MKKDIYQELYKNKKVEYFNKGEKELKELLIFYKKEGRRFDYFYNRLIRIIEKLYSIRYYINTSKKFNEIIKKFDVKYGYDQEGSYKMYSGDMKKEFHKTKEIKDNYKYEQFIIELAKIKAIQEVYSRFRRGTRIFELMYENDDFKRFGLREIAGNIENDEIFREQRWIKNNRNNPGVYLNQEDFEKKELELRASINMAIKNYRPQLDVNRKNNFDNMKFDLREEYQSKDILKKIYKILIQNHLSPETKFNDFLNVFTEPWSRNESKIYFSCSTQQTALFLSELKSLKIFKNFTFENIEKSKKFYFNQTSLVTANNISSSKKIFNPTNGLFNLCSEHLAIKKSVDKDIDKIKSIRLNNT